MWYNNIENGWHSQRDEHWGGKAQPETQMGSVLQAGQRLGLDLLGRVVLGWEIDRKRAPWNTTLILSRKCGGQRRRAERQSRQSWGVLKVTPRTTQLLREKGTHIV